MRFFLVILLAFCLSGCTRPDGPEVWRFAIEETAGSVQDAYAQKFKELVEARLPGVRVKVYPYGTLGTSDQITELLHMGAIQFAMASPGHLGKLIPETQILLLHFLFSKDWQVLNEDEVIRGSFDELYRRKGFKLLSIYSEGWMVWTTKAPVRTPADFAGMKFRTMTSPLLLAAYEAYGASATPMPYSEVYSGLQLNMIDGQVNPVFAIEEMSFYEVTDYLVFPRHAPFFTTAITGASFYDKLSLERKAVVDEVIEELVPFIDETQREFNAKRLEVIREKKPSIEVIRLTAEERGAFREAYRPVLEEFRRGLGDEGRQLLELIERAVRE